MRSIGLHLRIVKDLIDAAERAHALDIRSFQCFLVHQITKKRLSLTAQEVATFTKMRERFDNLYVHGTYWINLCGKNFHHAFRLLKKELELAKRIGFSHYILHPGSATGWPERQEGIDCLVSVLNDLLKQEHEIKIVLENTAHGGRSIGSNLDDLKIIRERIDFPEKLLFCIDTAHAHAYGYDIISKKGQDAFIELLEKTVGIDAIELIHLNDTNEKAGLKRDKHEMIGQGLIGFDSLKRFVMNDQLKKIPLILELPDVSEDVYKEIIQFIKKWDE